jgi:hypothetical protein
LQFLLGLIGPLLSLSLSLLLQCLLIVSLCLGESVARSEVRSIPSQLTVVKILLYPSNDKCVQSGSSRLGPETLENLFTKSRKIIDKQVQKSMVDSGASLCR